MMRGAMLLAVLALTACSGSEDGDNQTAAPTQAGKSLAQSQQPEVPSKVPAAIMIEDNGVPTLCVKGESVLSSCQAGSRTISVCGAADPSDGAQYRANLVDTRELSYPDSDIAGASTMRRATAAYSGGGEAQIQFDNKGSTYVVYSRVVRTRFDGQGNDPAFNAGVAVVKDDKTVGERLCTAPADADLNAPGSEAYMPEGEFIYIPEKDSK